MWRQYDSVDPTADLAVFHTRLTLSVIDVAGGPSSPRAASTVATLADRIFNWADGYAARDLLRHRGLAAGLTDRRIRSLATTIDVAGLDAGQVPADALCRLTGAVNRAESVIHGSAATRVSSACA
jgi:hypothetical protein